MDIGFMDAGGTQMATAAGQTPVGSYSEDDIFIVGYPKSGNTWMQNIVGAIVYGIEGIATNAGVQELVPDIQSVNSYRRTNEVMFFKTHSLPRPEHKRVVYLLRDGRDAMVSYYHFLCVITGRPIIFRRLIETGDELFPCKWKTHVAEWMQNPHGAEMIIIRYEDLVRDSVKEMKRLCKFANLTRSDEFLEEVGRQTTFEKLREKEKEFGMPGPWPRDHDFHRRGVVGSHRDEMEPSLLEEFMKDSGDALRQCGYAK